MEEANSGHGESSMATPDGNETTVEFAFEIAIIDGERGRRLAVVQANAILEVLEWFSRPITPPA
jgi:hypothetical protein